YYVSIIYVIHRPPPLSPFFPYTTLFRSEPRAVDHSRDQLAHLVRPAQVARDQAVDLGRVVARRLGLGQLDRRARRRTEVGEPERSEEHTSELPSLTNIVFRLLLGQKKVY